MTYFLNYRVKLIIWRGTGQASKHATDNNNNNNNRSSSSKRSKRSSLTSAPPVVLTPEEIDSFAAEPKLWPKVTRKVDIQISITFRMYLFTQMTSNAWQDH